MAHVVALHAGGYNFSASLTVERDPRTGDVHTYGVRVGATPKGDACISI